MVLQGDARTILGLDDISVFFKKLSQFCLERRASSDFKPFTHFKFRLLYYKTFCAKTFQTKTFKFLETLLNRT